LDLSIIQGPFSVAPCQTLVSRFAIFASLQGMSELEVARAKLRRAAAVPPPSQPAAPVARGKLSPLPVLSLLATWDTGGSGAR
jgi:hypothetical protein